MSTSKGLYIKQDELTFITDLVTNRLVSLNAVSNQFDANVDQMEKHVKEYRMAENIHSRLSKALGRPTLIDNNDNNNITTGAQDE